MTSKKDFGGDSAHVTLGLLCLGRSVWRLACDLIFRLDALALSVIATGTWLGGWLLHSGIVSKRLNLSENFFDRLKAPSL